MSKELTAVAAQSTEQTANSQAVLVKQNDGITLYGSRLQAEAAGRLKSAGAPVAAAKNLAEVTRGGKSLSKDGQTIPCTLNGLLEFQVTGFVAVMVVMAGLWLVCSVAGRLIRSFGQASVEPSDRAAANSAGSLSAQPVEACGLHPGLTDQQLVVILTAVAAEVLSSPVQISRIRPVSPGDSNWAAQGRSVLHSHKLN
jgi:hypothetical protein